MFDKLDPVTGGTHYTPEQIANSSNLTKGEKIELLERLKMKATNADATGEEYHFSPEEIDHAIGEVKKHARDDANIKVDVAIGRSGV